MCDLSGARTVSDGYAQHLQGEERSLRFQLSLKQSRVPPVSGCPRSRPDI